jgi:uncharacterized protein (DUF302 family)
VDIEGIITRPSRYAAAETSARLAAWVASNGMSVFARIDHSAGAAAVGMPLQPVEVLIFGSAKGGTPLMQADPTIGLDLPLKALIWEDGEGGTWLSYHQVTWLAKGHSLETDHRMLLEKLDSVLESAAQHACGSKL